jgi:hypothetical protein
MTTNLTEFERVAKALCAEFDEHKGEISCEFSTSEKLLSKKMKLLALMSCEYGYWTIDWCGTCFEHHGKTGEFHCELRKHGE